eukprot:jgi/Tetstr1/447327/TSEL_034764.t1
MTKPDAVQNLMMHSLKPHDALPVPGTGAGGTARAAADHRDPADQEESDLLKFVYSDEDRGALDQFFKNKVADPRFAENEEMVQNAHLKAGSYGIQDGSFLKIPHEARINQPSDVMGMDTFASEYSCPV